MPHLNYDKKEIIFKIVYFGPGMSGKTTNLIHIHKTMTAHLKSDMVVLDTTGDRTLFFDFLPMELGEVEGYKIRFNMYTVPGQVHYEASRRLILDGADGVVFVADSNQAQLEENIGSFQMMIENLRYYGFDPKVFPLVLQFNKRDCENPVDPEDMRSKLELKDLPAYMAVAVKGEGVMETIREISKLIITRFQL